MHDARRATRRTVPSSTLDTSLTSLTSWVYLVIAIIAIAWATASPVLEI